MRASARKTLPLQVNSWIQARSFRTRKCIVERDMVDSLSAHAVTSTHGEWLEGHLVLAIEALVVSRVRLGQEPFRVETRGSTQWSGSFWMFCKFTPMMFWSRVNRLANLSRSGMDDRCRKTQCAYSSRNPVTV